MTKEIKENRRSAIWKSGGKHLDIAIKQDLACTGTSSRKYPSGACVIVADKLDGGDWKVALGIATGEVVDRDPNDVWSGWGLSKEDSEKVVINKVNFFMTCNHVPVSVVGKKTSQTDIYKCNRQAVIDYVKKNGEMIV